MRLTKSLFAAGAAVLALFLLPGIATAQTASDLQIAKIGAPEPVVAGQNLTYTIPINNAGPDVVNATVTDILPAGTTFVSGSGPAGFTCTTPAVGGTGTVTCNDPAYGVGAGGVFTLVVNVNPSTTGTISNTATIAGAGNTDPLPGDNSATATNTVTAQSDLLIAKAGNPEPVTAGTNLTYTVIVQNTGPSDAQTVTVTDVMPPGTLFVSGSAPGTYTCTTPAVGTNGTITCTTPTVAAGATDALTFVVFVPANTPAGSTLVNNASVASPTDPNVGNNTATANNTVSAAVDLGVTKTAAPEPVAPGGTLTYTVTATNAGPSDAPNVVLTDTLPAGVTFTGFTAPAGVTCSEAAGVVTCNAPTFPAGGTAVITITVTVNPTTTGTITNNVTITSAATEVGTAPNAASATSTVTPQADLGVTKSDSPDPVLAGQNITYTITATNAGPNDAVNAVLVDTLDPGVTFQSVAAPAGVTCTGTGPVTCTAPTFTAGASAVITLVVRVNNATSGSVTNNVTISSDTTDPGPTPNAASQTTTITPTADIAVAKTAGVGPFFAGGNVNFTISVTNNGPLTATNVTVIDTLPAGTTFVSATGPSSTCTGTGPVTCTIATLAPAATEFISLVVTAPTAGTITNSVTANATEPDAFPANNTTTANATVQPSADIQVTKTAGPGPFTAGGNVDFTVTVTNLGPSAATNVNLTDTLPAGTTFVSATPSQGTCSGTGPVTCALGGLASGASATIGVVVQSSTTAGTLTNSATATATENDPNAANNTATATATTGAIQSDLGVTKTGTPATVSPGSNITYTINVTNAGPSATQVTLTDTLDANTTFLSIAAGSYSCTTPAVGATGTITCSRPTQLVSGGTDTLTLVVNVPATTTATSFTNTVTVATLGPSTDPNAGNNTATATNAIAPTADLSIAKVAGSGPFTAGGNVDFTITVTNNGPSTATGVTVTDTLPAGSTFVSATPSAGTCAGTGPVTCTIGTMASGATATIGLVVQSSTTAGTLTNTASVTATSPADPNAANNTATATATTSAVPTTDLAITKTAGAGPFTPGGNVSFTITATNNGPSTATGVTVTDTLPAGSTFVSATPSQGTCSGTGPVTCTVGTLASGASATIAVVVQSSATPGTLTNTATISGAETDPNAANNTATASATTTTGAAGIPTMSTWMLLLMGAALAAVALKMRF